MLDNELAPESYAAYMAFTAESTIKAATYNNFVSYQDLIQKVKYRLRLIDHDLAEMLVKISLIELSDIVFLTKKGYHLSADLLMTENRLFKKLKRRLNG